MKRKCKNLLLFSIMTLLIVSSILALAGCRPGYKEVWEPVSVPTLKWVENGDIGVISERIQEDLLDEKLDVTSIKNIMRSDGKFEGFDYEIETRTESWAPLEHLRNTEKLLIAYKSVGNENYRNPEIKDFIKKSIEFWVDNNFYCKWSGWNNTIGLGLTIPNILLLDDGNISAQDREKLLDRIKGTLLQNSKKRFKLYEREVGESGGNLTDQVNATLKVAVIENDGNIIMWLKGLLDNELRPFPAYKGANYHRWDAEGPKEDFSFQQHDQMLYYGGYGEVFVNGLNRYMKYTKNTQYMLDQKALDFYADFIAEGIQFVTRNGYRDISASGRGVARKNGLRGIFPAIQNATNALLEYSKDCNNLSADKVAKLERIKRERFGNIDRGAGGHRYLYESDYNVYNGEKYMATVRHASNRTRIYEYLNYENYLGYYTGLGATFYYVDGDEYYNLMPVYDWNKIPGTTTRQGVLPKLSQDSSYNRYGNNKYVGGVSTGKVGLSTYRQNDHFVKAQKGYFMFEDGVVCLGSGISGTMPNRLTTNVNQTKWKGEVVIGQNGKTRRMGSAGAFSGKVDFIYHNKISYISDNDLNLTLYKDKTGSWDRVYTLGSKEVVKDDIFTLDINHRLYKTSDYAYTVLLNTTVEETENYVKNPHLKVIENSKNIQAVYDSKNDILQVIFLKAGSVQIDGKVVSANAPCSMVVENLKGDSICFIASNDYENHNVSVTCGAVKSNVNITKKSQKI